MDGGGRLGLARWCIHAPIASKQNMFLRHLSHVVVCCIIQVDSKSSVW